MFTDRNTYFKVVVFCLFFLIDDHTKEKTKNQKSLSLNKMVFRNLRECFMSILSLMQ